MYRRTMPRSLGMIMILPASAEWIAQRERMSGKLLCGTLSNKEEYSALVSSLVYLCRVTLPVDDSPQIILGISRTKVSGP